MMQNWVWSSLRSLSIHCQPFPQRSKQPKGDRPAGNALTGVVPPQHSAVTSPTINARKSVILRVRDVTRRGVSLPR